jgi:hypothetical protein
VPLRLLFYRRAASGVPVVASSAMRAVSGLSNASPQGCLNGTGFFDGKPRKTAVTSCSQLLDAVSRGIDGYQALAKVGPV